MHIACYSVVYLPMRPRPTNPKVAKLLRLEMNVRRVKIGKKSLPTLRSVCILDRDDRTKSIALISQMKI